MEKFTILGHTTATQEHLLLSRLGNFINLSGFFFFSEKEISHIICKYKSLGYRIFKLPKNIQSKDDFFNGIRKVLPLDPPLISNKSWDALDDSLWSGLDSLPENNILIIWPSVYPIKNTDTKSFMIINEIFKNLPKSLAEEKAKKDIQFNLVIIGII